MPGPRLRGLLLAACLPLLFAACGSETSSLISTPDGPAAAALKGARVALTGGGGQAGTPGQPLPGPVVVRVTDAGGRPVAGVPLAFNPGTNGDADPRMTVTDAEGYARTAWIMGPELGTQTMRVTGTGLSLSVTARVLRGGGTRVGIIKRRGEEQTGPAGAPLPVAIQALVVRDDGTPVPGAVLTFAASDGGRANRATYRTTADGLAYITWTLGSRSGEQTLTATLPSAAPAVFTATATGGTQRAAVALVILPDSMVLDVGGTGAFSVSLANPGEPDLPGQAPRWTTSDPTVAEVDDRGTVRGVAPGTAVITATLGSRSASATVRVRGRVPAILALVPDSLVLEVGGTGGLSAVVRDAQGAQIPGVAPAWSSSAPGVATVDAQGQVRGVAAGTARVTATLGTLSASATVRVRGAAGPTLELFPDSLVLDVGVWARVYPVARDAAGRPVIVDYAVQWSTSSDQVVYPFADGSLLPQAAGTARVTARWGNLTASIPVRVRQPRGGSLRIPQIQMRAGYAPRIEATTRDLDTNWWIHISQRNVSAVTMRVRGPAGRTIDCTNAGPESIYGDEFRCDLTLPRGSEPGVWKVDRVTVTKDGQTTTFTAADLEAQGTLGRAFDLFGTGPDTQAPVVRTIWPHQGTRYPDIYYVNVGILDHVSGMRSARMTVRGPGGVTHTCEMSPTAGVCRLPLRPGSGTWDIVSVETEDMTGNRATYTAQQIAQLASGMSEAPFLVYSFTP